MQQNGLRSLSVYRGTSVTCSQCKGQDLQHVISFLESSIPLATPVFGSALTRSGMLNPKYTSAMWMSCTGAAPKRCVTARHSLVLRRAGRVVQLRAAGAERSTQLSNGSKQAAGKLIKCQMSDCPPACDTVAARLECVTRLSLWASEQMQRVWSAMSASAEYDRMWDCIQLWEIASGRAPVGEVVDGAVVVGVPQGGYIGAHEGCVGVVALDVAACHLLRQRDSGQLKVTVLSLSVGCCLCRALC